MTSDKRDVLVKGDGAVQHPFVSGSSRYHKPHAAGGGTRIFILRYYRSVLLNRDIPARVRKWLLAWKFPFFCSLAGAPWIAKNVCKVQYLT
jgi:hypothetical protein